jgi:hypothetical protein
MTYLLWLKPNSESKIYREDNPKYLLQLKSPHLQFLSGVLEFLIAAKCPSTIGGVIRFEMPSKAAMDGFVMAVIPSEDEY